MLLNEPALNYRIKSQTHFFLNINETGECPEQPKHSGPRVYVDFF